MATKIKKENQDTKEIKFLPVAVYLSDLKYYSVNSILEVLKNPLRNFFDEEKTVEYFNRFSEELYLPILEFLLEYQIQANIILTGSFLNQAKILYPKIIQVLKRLHQSGNIQLVVDNYYGAGLTCFYNPLVWAEGVLKSCQMVKEVFEVNPNSVYLPQLYRNLELERLTEHGLTNFLLRNFESKAHHFEMWLSDLRRYEGYSVAWIKPKNDVKCTFSIISENLFFETNWNIFQPNLKEASKAFSMAAGLASIDFQINLKKGKGKPLPSIPRINERYSVAKFNNLQQSVIRLWEYASILVGSQMQGNFGFGVGFKGLENGTAKIFEKVVENKLPILGKLDGGELNQGQKIEDNGYKVKFSKNTLEDFFALQSTEFLIYLNSSPYYNLQGVKNSLNFTSPHEAFVCMQTAVKQIEILIRNRV
jgi:hypothetical protein